MPDGDKVHARLAYRYQQSYIQLCEGRLTDEVIARNVSRVVRKDLQDYGDGPLDLLANVAMLLARIQDRPLFIDTEDWAGHSQTIKRIAGCIRASKTAIGLALRACDRQKQEVRHRTSAHDIDLAITRKYVQCIYSARFEGQIPLTERHYNDVDPATLDARLGRIRPLVMQELDALSAQIVQSHSVARLRMRRRLSKRRIDIHDSLVPLGQ